MTRNRSTSHKHGTYSPEMHGKDGLGDGHHPRHSGSRGEMSSERSHRHAFAGDKSHDQHIGGKNGGNHLAQGAAELERQHPAKDQSPRDTASQRDRAPRAQTNLSGASAGVSQGPGRPAPAPKW